MTQSTQLVELQSLQAQLNALTQITLRAVAALEMTHLIDGQVLEGELREVRWPEPLNREARFVMAELCDLLQAARNSRQSQVLRYWNRNDP